jgi:RNA polymerase sigma factor (TIGR02999 family)
MAGERADHTLQATALVNEAWLRLRGGARLEDAADRASFCRAAAAAMRRILVDHARSRSRVKRGAGADRRRVPLDAVAFAAECDPADVLILDEALGRLEAEDAGAAEIVRLRYFAGLSVDETAAALGVSPSRVDRDWRYARAWLHREMGRAGG